MNKLTQKHIKISFFISLAYVGLGTICVLPIFRDTILDGDWRVYATLLTLPVNFISVAIMYAGLPTAITLIIIVQLTYFLLFWFIVYQIIRRKAKKKNIPPLSSSRENDGSPSA
jgi:hypothetical protein